MKTTVEAGKWYFHVVCHFCSRPITLMEDESKGTEPVHIDREQETLACPHCGKSDAYQIGEVRTEPAQYRQ